jgi:hypothetical protein
MGSEARMRRAVPDTVRLLKQQDWRSDCPQADRNGKAGHVLRGAVPERAGSVAGMEGG